MPTFTTYFDETIELTEEGVTWLAECEANTVHNGRDLQSFAKTAFEGDLVRAYDVLDVLYREYRIVRDHDNRLTTPYQRGRRIPEGVEPGLGVPCSEDYVKPMTNADHERNRRYFAAIDNITASWQSLIDAVNVELEAAWKSYQGVGSAKPEAGMWQTGGMCMVIGWTVTRDDVKYDVMLGEGEGPLSHDRAEAGTGGFSLSCGTEEDQLTGEAPFITIPYLPVRRPEHDKRIAHAVVMLAKTLGELATER